MRLPCRGITQERAPWGDSVVNTFELNSYEIQTKKRGSEEPLSINPEGFDFTLQLQPAT